VCWQKKQVKMSKRRKRKKNSRSQKKVVRPQTNIVFVSEKAATWHVFEDAGIYPMICVWWGNLVSQYLGNFSISNIFSTILFPSKMNKIHHPQISHKLDVWSINPCGWFMAAIYYINIMRLSSEFSRFPWLPRQLLQRLLLPAHTNAAAHLFYSWLIPLSE
jgi:hypothetical protein